MKRTPLYEAHVKLSAKIVPFSGFEMPLSYTGVTDEHHAVRSAVGLFDISHMGRFEIEGKGAEAYLERVTTGPVRKIVRGGAQYGMLLKPSGGIIDDIYLYRRGTNTFTMIVNAANREKDFNWLNVAIKGESASDVALTDRTEETALLALQGPKSWEVLLKIIPFGEKEISLRHFIEVEMIPVRGYKGLIARTGYTGEKGYELLIPAPSAPPLWEAILEAGKPEGIKPIGLGARDTLRLEMGYMLYGHDINEETTPVEADLLRFIDLEKEFIGKETLLQKKKDGTPRRFVGFELAAGGVPREGHSI
ncbi:MAG TPA: glycine cleavage system aminomethyltransferase GcvT, partial [Nitrospiria bacterium]|nr:glycine cleavage system aminomethyltransferase GcvT [Nitrospiria bacterium]